MNTQLEEDVRRTVRETMAPGGGIITGGALNVDYIAVDEALKHDPEAKRIKIFLPSSLDRYKKHYRKRANEKVITGRQAETLIVQLETVAAKNPAAIIGGTAGEITEETYHERNSAIIDAADELYAFHVNGTLGVQDSIDKARKKGIAVEVMEYVIP